MNIWKGKPLARERICYTRVNESEYCAHLESRHDLAEGCLEPNCPCGGFTPGMELGLGADGQSAGVG